MSEKFFIFSHRTFQMLTGEGGGLILEISAPYG